jgi:hypothetical protein
MKIRSLLSLLFIWLPLIPVVYAHHSFASEFDTNQPVKMTGVVTKVEWQNPHIWFYMDVKNPDGSVTNWGFSGGAPGQLTRRGITKKAIPEGSTVTVEGFKSKDGSNNANGARVTFPDGRSVFTASSEDQIPGDGKGKTK